MKISGNACLLMVIMVIMAAIIAASAKMEHIQSKAFPLTISSFVFVLAGIALTGEFLKSARSKTAARTETSSDQSEAAGNRRQYLLAGAWLAGFFLGIYLVGFIIASAVFAFVYMKRHNTRWVTAGVFAIIAPVFLYVMFTVLMHVSLYPGLLLSFGE